MRNLDVTNIPKFGRTKSLIRCLTEFHNVNNGKFSIVEIGCIRGKNKGSQLGDGWSTLAFGWYCSNYNGQLYTIDNKQKAIDICKKVVSEYSSSIVYLCGDSLVGLQKIKDMEIEINLLYLDGSANPECSYNEYNLIKDNLASSSIVLIDDVHIKGELVVPQLKKEGWTDLGIIETQQLFIRSLGE